MAKRRHGFPAVKGLTKKRTKFGHRWILSELDSTGKMQNVTVPILDTDTDKIFFEKIDEARKKIQNRGKSLDDYIDAYVHERQLTAQTARAMHASLRGFGFDNAKNRELVDAIVSGMQKISTKMSKISRVRAFYSWLAEYMPGIENPARGCVFRAKFTYRQRVATDDEIEQIRRKIESKKDDRLLLFFLLLMHTGARASTIACMTRNSLDRSGRLHLYNVKSKKIYSYTIPMIDANLRALWQRVTASGKLWSTVEANRLHDRIYRIMHTLGADQFGEYLSPHSLRHTFATRALQAGVPAEIVSKLLDHSSVSITLNVYARYSQEQIDSAIEKIRY